MARQLDCSSDIAVWRRVVRPTNLRKLLRSLCRGANELNQLHRHLAALFTGEARLTDVSWSDTPPGHGTG
ncbi:MAG: hypothetical protein GDA53_02350 [Rhodobacteraceae bacterium]|nr:hypothetical protein [Paracoccaceae bacterium]